MRRTPFCLALCLTIAGLPTVAGALSAQVPAEARDASEGLLAWMGLEPGDTMAFVASDSTRVCVTVGSRTRIGGRGFAPLLGLSWPGFASDSRIFVPLDGLPGFYVDWTPGPRPTAEGFLPPGGWSRHDPGWAAADRLVYRSCEVCVDAGTTVVLEKGGGIRSIARQSIVGPTRLTRLEGGCAEREGVKLELYVEPAPAREP